MVVFFTGFSGSGKSTLAKGLADYLTAQVDRAVTLLDGDVVRRLLSSGLGFDRAGRDLNVRRIGFVAAEVARHGGIAVCAPIAPYAESRAAVREMVEAVGDLVLVHVATSLEECERRDVKGLYKKARAGVVTQFTGISDPYDEPLDAELRVDTTGASFDESLAVITGYLEAGGWLPTQIARVAQSAEAARVAQSAEAAQVAQSAEAAQVAQSAEAAQVAQVAQVAQSAQSAESAESARVTQQDAESAESGQGARGAEGLPGGQGLAVDVQVEG